jgi:RNA polymerase sigma-70 factor (ECF subfamily)
MYMMEYDDKIYIQRTLAGDTDAFSILVERYQALVFSVVVRMVRQAQDAEDVAQDVFVKAYSSLAGFRGESRFSTWLCRIAFTTSASYTRRYRPDRAGIEINNDRDAPAADEGDHNLREERLQRLQRLLVQLSPEDAALLTLYYRHGKTMDEIATVVGQTTANVKVRLHRIRKKLYEGLKQ